MAETRATGSAVDLHLLRRLGEDNSAQLHKCGEGVPRRCQSNCLLNSSADPHPQSSPLSGGESTQHPFTFTSVVTGITEDTPETLTSADIVQKTVGRVLSQALQADSPCCWHRRPHATTLDSPGKNPVFATHPLPEL